MNLRYAYLLREPLLRPSFLRVAAVATETVLDVVVEWSGFEPQRHSAAEPLDELGAPSAPLGA